MVQRRDRSGFLLEAETLLRVAGGAVGQHLDCNGAAQSRVGRLVDRAHTARTEQGDNLVRAEPGRLGRGPPPPPDAGLRTRRRYPRIIAPGPGVWCPGNARQGNHGVASASQTRKPPRMWPFMSPSLASRTLDQRQYRSAPPCTAPPREADVVGLLGRQLRQLGAEVIEVQARHLLVELLVERVDLDLVRLGPEPDLRQGLVGEAVGHHEARVARWRSRGSPAGPSASRMIEWPSGKVNLSTCGLMFVR